MAKKKQVWFDVPDSLTEEEQGNKIIKYYNVEAHFSDHKVLDIRASQEARYNVYTLVPAMFLRIKRAAMGQPAVKNVTPIVLRFDKGRALPRPDFEECITAISRCWQAWEHYQADRKAEVLPEEKTALMLISRGPKPEIARVFKRKLRQIVVEDEDEDDDDEGEEIEATEVGAGPEAGSSGGNRAPASGAPKAKTAASGARKPAGAPKTAKAKKNTGR